MLGQRLRTLLVGVGLTAALTQVATAQLRHAPPRRDTRAVLNIRTPRDGLPVPVPRPHGPVRPPDPAAAPETKPVESKPVQSKPVQSKPGDLTPGETKPVDVKPVDAGPAETRPVDAKPADTPRPSPPPAPRLPGVAASGPARQPAADPGCLARLTATAVAADPVAIGPQPDARCTVADAVKLRGLKLADGADVAFPDTPTIACVTADTFAAYVRELLSPLAKGSYGAAIARVWTGPGLECRSRDHIFGAKLSAHGQGLAVDIAQMALTDGHTIEVGMPKTDLDRAFETAARAGGCGYFHTTLGPGSDSYHKTHWHFDLEPRGSKGDGKFCQ